MKKNIFIISTVLLIISFSLYSARAEDIQLLIKEKNCTEEGVVIKYSLINQRKFDRPNVSIAFMVMSEGKPLACKEIITVVPKNADGSDIKETFISVECKGKSLKLVSRVFHNTKRYHIDEWLSGCP